MLRQRQGETKEKLRIVIESPLAGLILENRGYKKAIESERKVCAMVLLVKRWASR